MHGIVARSTFASEHVQSTAGFGALLSIEMFEECRRLLGEAHLEVKMVKASQGHLSSLRGTSPGPLHRLGWQLRSGRSKEKEKEQVTLIRSRESRGPRLAGGEAGILAEFRRFKAVHFHFLEKARGIALLWTCKPRL